MRKKERKKGIKVNSVDPYKRINRTNLGIDKLQRINDCGKDDRKHMHFKSDAKCSNLCGVFSFQVHIVTTSAVEIKCVRLSP